MSFRPRHLLYVLAVIIACPVMTVADPVSGALLIAFLAAANNLAIGGIIAAASYGLGKLAQAIGPKAKATEYGRQDIRVTTSREGENVRRIYNKFAVGGQVIQAGLARENRQTSTVGSGKRRTTNVEIYYSMSFGVLACENVNSSILGVSCVWFDNKIVYSVDSAALDGTNPAVITSFGGYIGAPQIYAGGARAFQILLGQEDQTDRCDWHVAYEGFGDEDSVPGYRGAVTLWWHDLDLRPYYNRLPQILIEVVSADGTIREIITAQCKAAGIDTDTELDVSGIGSTITIPGMFVDGPTPGKQVLEAMALYSPFGIVEVDGGLKAFDLPTDSSVTIPEGDLGAYVGGIEDGGERPTKFSLGMEQSTELPMRVDVTYFDAFDTYQQATRGYSRQVGDAKGTQQLFMPMALTSYEASSIASRTVTSAHAEGDPVKLSLMPKYIEYHPGDESTVPAPDGTEIDVRWMRMNFEPGGLIEVEGVRQIRLTGAGTPDDTPSVEPDPTDGGLPVDSVFVASNVPPLIDDHDGFGGFYVAAVPKTQPTDADRPWTGALFIMNLCGSDEGDKQYVAIARTGTPATIGKAMDELADGSGVDAVNTVDIFLAWGGGNIAIAGILDDAFTKTTEANLCILGKEILQFRDVLDVSDLYSHPAGSGFVYRLSHLKRGLRGTAHMTATHAEDDPFVLWSPDSVIRVPRDYLQFDNAWNIKCLSDGQAEADLDPLTFTIEHDGETLLKEDA